MGGCFVAFAPRNLRLRFARNILKVRNSDMWTERFAFGLGITLPNGLASKWSDTGFARYVSTYSSLKVIDLNTAMAWQIFDKLSVGFGFSLYYSDVKLQSMVDYGNFLFNPGAFDGMMELEGDGFSWGYNLGILYHLNDEHSFAVTLKSAFTIDYSGEIHLKDMPWFVKLFNFPDYLEIGPSYESKVDTSLEFPMVVVLGYAYRPIEKLKLEAEPARY